MIQLPTGYYWDPEFQLGEESEAISLKVWPRYLVEKSDIEEAELNLEFSYNEFVKRYPAWGIRSQADGRLAAYGNGVYINTDLNAPELPQKGWNYVIHAGAEKQIPNCLALVVVNVDPEFRSLRLSYNLIDRAKEAARGFKLKSIIAPVRPSQKHLFPDDSIETYVNRRRADGEFEDAWLRVHARAGAEKLNICYESAEVRASLKCWNEWTGLEFAKSGDYPLERGLAPLVANIESGEGIYVEPNVWFRYAL